METASQITFDDFMKVDIRVGEIVSVEDFPEARKPAYKLRINLGSELGEKRSSAQLPQRYEKEELLGKRILCVINFPPKQIGPTVSEVLVLGVPDSEGNAILIGPDRDVPLGGRLY